MDLDSINHAIERTEEELEGNDNDNIFFGPTKVQLEWRLKELNKMKDKIESIKSMK